MNFKFYVIIIIRTEGSWNTPNHSFDTLALSEITRKNTIKCNTRK